MAALSALPCFSVPALRLPPSQWNSKTWKSQEGSIILYKTDNKRQETFSEDIMQQDGLLSYLIYLPPSYCRLSDLLNKKMYQEEVLTS